MIAEAILKINPNAQVTVINDEYDSIIWNDTPLIPEEQILAIIPQVELNIAMQTLRTKRNKLIAQTDYLALSDNTLSTNMSTYRQSLRDITNGLTTIEQVNNITWPIKP